MDEDLISEIHRLERVCREEGVQAFGIACWESWTAPFGTKSQSPLFRACTPSGREERRPDGKLCGCLVEVKYPQYPTGPRVAWTDKWTEEIRRDERIPDTMGELRPEHLYAFAEWQQKMRDHISTTNNLRTINEGFSQLT